MFNYIYKNDRQDWTTVCLIAKQRSKMLINIDKIVIAVTVYSTREKLLSNAHSYRL